MTPPRRARPGLVLVLAASTMTLVSSVAAAPNGPSQSGVPPNLPGEAAASGASGGAALQPDTVQIIEPRSGAEPPPSRARAAESAADSPVRIDAGGWAKERVDFFPLEDPHPAAGRSNYDFRTDLFVRAHYARGRHIEVNASGSLTHTVFHGQDDYRGSFDPQLREASVGVFTSDLDFRFGQQRLAWGVTDFLSPNDVLNAKDLRDPFVGEEELRFLPTPLLRADWYVGIVTFQLVYGPWFVPDRYDVYGTNWAGIQPDAPTDFRNTAANMLAPYDRTLFDQAQRLYQQSRLPAADFTEPSAGGQIAINGEGFDLHFYYQYGFEGPYVALDASGMLSATFLRRHHVGMAATVAAGPIVFRLEGAYQSQRSFFRTDLLSFKSPVGEVAGAIEWQTGDPAKVALLELYYQRIAQGSQVPLLAWEQDSYGAGFSFRWPIFGALRTNSRILMSAQPVALVAKPELELNFDEWIVGAGWLGVAGADPSFGWYYRKNSEAFAFVKWLF
jgi:hypothetical protein